MTESYKNLLQEIQQKNKLPLPKYTNSKTENNNWKTILIVNDETYYGIGTNKKEADFIAAKTAYHTIMQTEQIKDKKDNIVTVEQKAKDISNINFNNYDTVILIDGENADLDASKIDSITLVLCFVAKNTTKKIVFNNQKQHSNYYVFISESVGKDAADHLLTFYAGKLSICQPEKQYYILTKDHYGEFIEKFMANCKFICSQNEINK